MAMTHATSSLHSSVRRGGTADGWWLGRALRNLQGTLRTRQYPIHVGALG
jgi:hypothetical protein